LLTDIVMPGGLDGIELARLARERWPSLKVVLTSGFPHARVDGNGDLLGSLRLLSKSWLRLCAPRWMGDDHGRYPDYR
jgi:hypothetical protein